MLCWAWPAPRARASPGARAPGHADLQLVALAHQLQLDGAASAAAMQHGVLHQRLQYQARQGKIPGQRLIALPAHLQTLAQAQ